MTGYFAARNKNKVVGTKRALVGSYTDTSDKGFLKPEKAFEVYFDDNGKVYNLRESSTWYNPIPTYELVNSGITVKQTSVITKKSRKRVASMIKETSVLNGTYSVLVVQQYFL